MNNLATVLSLQGKYEQAEEMLRQALETERDSAGQRASSKAHRHYF
jgi:Flp pilus assembly protein TadD